MTAINTGKYLHIVETIVQHIVVLFFLLILWELFKNHSFKDYGTWHIILCSFGFAICVTEALLLFSKQSELLKDVDRVKRGTYHAALMTLACVLVTIGVALKIVQTNDIGFGHFKFTHGKLGLAAWILLIIAVFAGIFVSNARRFSGLARPIWFKVCHLILGASAYIMGAVAVGYGLSYLEINTSENGRIALIVFLVIFVTYSLIGGAVTCFNLVFNK